MSWPVFWDLFGGRGITALFVTLVVWVPFGVAAWRCVRNGRFHREPGE